MRHYDLPPLDQLEAFEASARHLSFTKAADELALTQSAVSRQIAALEQHFGLPLFRRMHRALLLTDDGQTLFGAVAQVLGHLHQVGSDLKRDRRAKTVVMTTTPGFAGLWLIPRLGGFTTARPDVDVRISAVYKLVNLNRDGFDLAVRYQAEEEADESDEMLFGEVVTPVCSPKLLRDPARPLKKPEDLSRHVLLHLEYGAGADMQDWPIWLRAMKLEGLKPASVLHFSQFDQLINAALNGQGVALGRSPLLKELLRERKLVAPFAKTVASPRSYYIVQSPSAARKPEVQEFVAWLREEAHRTSSDDDSPAVATRAETGKPETAKPETAKLETANSAKAKVKATSPGSSDRAGRVRA